MKRLFVLLIGLALISISSEIKAFWGPYYPAPYYGPYYGPGYGYGYGRYNKGAAIASGILGAGSLLAGAAAYGD